MGGSRVITFEPLPLIARLRAVAIDACWLVLVSAAALALAVSWTGTPLHQFRIDPQRALEHALRGSPPFWGTLGFLVLLALLYQVIFLTVGGATPGLRSVGGRVIDAYGRNPAVARALIRGIGVIVTVLTGGLGLVIAQLNKNRRSLADRLSGTYVICT